VEIIDLPASLIDEYRALILADLKQPDREAANRAHMSCIRSVSNPMSPYIYGHIRNMLLFYRLLNAAIFLNRLLIVMAVFLLLASIFSSGHYYAFWAVLSLGLWYLINLAQFRLTLELVARIGAYLKLMGLTEQSIQ
jgi:hypothetical protein